MLLQDAPIIVGCSVCGRPAKVHQEHVQEQSAEPQPRALSQPRAFVVEHRDEVFAQIAADLAGAGYRVVRATSATRALKACRRSEPRLVLANVDL